MENLRGLQIPAPLRSPLIYAYGGRGSISAIALHDVVHNKLHEILVIMLHTLFFADFKEVHYNSTDLGIYTQFKQGC